LHLIETNHRESAAGEKSIAQWFSRFVFTSCSAAARTIRTQQPQLLRIPSRHSIIYTHAASQHTPHNPAAVLRQLRIIIVIIGTVMMTTTMQK
jgi:hypothetical protein